MSKRAIVESSPLTAAAQEPHVERNVQTTRLWHIPLSDLEGGPYPSEWPSTRGQLDEPREDGWDPTAEVDQGSC